MASSQINEITETLGNQNNKVGQSKPPSKKLRDRLRMLSFRRKKDKKGPETPTKEESTQTVKSDNLFYNTIEDSMRLARLEDAAVLITALRHLIRKTHPNGDRITFPVPEAVDRIQLGKVGVPTDPAELHELLKTVFKRRKETLNIEELYNDFVKTHGRLAFDMSKKWPESHIHTRHP